MNEFGFEHGKVGKGILPAVGGALEFLVVPLVIILGTAALMEGLVEDGADLLGLNDLLPWIAVLGIAITVLSFFRGFYPKGSLSRMTFGLATMATVGLWVWTITRGGDLRLDVGELGMSVDFTGLVLLFLVVVALRGLFFVVEMLSHRTEWLTSLPEAAPTPA